MVSQVLFCNNGLLPSPTLARINFCPQIPGNNHFNRAGQNLFNKNLLLMKIGFSTTTKTFTKPFCSLTKVFISYSLGKISPFMSFIPSVYSHSK